MKGMIDIFCCSPSGCWPSREAVAPQGDAVGVDMSQPFRLLAVAEPYRHGVSLKSSDRYCRWHGHRLMVRAAPIQSLKGSDRYTLRHRRRMLPIAFSSMSLKGSDRYYPAA